MIPSFMIAPVLALGAGLAAALALLTPALTLMH